MMYVILTLTRLQGDLTELPALLLAKLHFTFPFELPGVYNPNACRARAWMDTVQLPADNQNIQFKTCYARYLLQTSLKSMVDNFSREYLLEYIEREAETAINPGISPQLSLGSEQRFASKGAYIVQWDPATEGNLKAVGDWIVP